MDIAPAAMATALLRRDDRSWPEAWTALAYNLIPVLGVTIWRWDVFALVFLYWSENVVIGVRTLLSMLVSGGERGPLSLVGALPLSVFFCIHYGMFCFVHGIFVVTLFGQSGHASGSDLLEAIVSLTARAPNIVFAFISIVIWQAAAFAGFLLRGEAKTKNPSDLMGAPYPRIVALHIAILFGGMLVMALGQPVWAIVILALMKTLIDVGPRVPAKPSVTATP